MGHSYNAREKRGLPRAWCHHVSADTEHGSLVDLVVVMFGAALRSKEAVAIASNYLLSLDATTGARGLSHAGAAHVASGGFLVTTVSVAQSGAMRWRPSRRKWISFSVWMPSSATLPSTANTPRCALLHYLQAEGGYAGAARDEGNAARTGCSYNAQEKEGRMIHHARHVWTCSNGWRNRRNTGSCWTWRRRLVLLCVPRKLAL